jgi:type IV fimbrial biogenesis protein FimT
MLIDRSPHATTVTFERGVTLIEVIVTIALVAILMRLAVPAFTGWIRNTQMRSVAEALQNGLRNAQSEAVRRNRQVVFFLSDAETSSEAAASAAAAAANGVNWAIRTVRPVAGAGIEFIEGGSFADSARGVAITGPAAICFNSQGRLVANDNVGSIELGAVVCGAGPAQYDVSQTGAERRLQINITAGGQLRMCDPDVSIADRPIGCS